MKCNQIGPNCNRTQIPHKNSTKHVVVHHCFFKIDTLLAAVNSSASLYDVWKETSEWINHVSLTQRIEKAIHKTYRGSHATFSLILVSSSLWREWFRKCYKQLKERERVKKRLEKIQLEMWVWKWLPRALSTWLVVRLEDSKCGLRKDVQRR